MADSDYTGDPTDSDVNWIRDKIGDVDSDCYYLTDDEIQSEVADNSNLYVAAASCCFKCTTRLGEYEALANRFEKLGNRLLKDARRRTGFSSSTPSVGTLTDAGTQPRTYDVIGEKQADWSLNPDDLPSQVRGVDV